jgi:hypothetical protein
VTATPLPKLTWADPYAKILAQKSGRMDYPALCPKFLSRRPFNTC